MRSHGRLHPAVEWIEGCGENIPLADASADGVVSTLAVCHFSDVPKAMDEMARISSNGSIVIFTFDCNVARLSWQYEYFPFFWDAFDSCPSPNQLAEMLAKATKLETKVATFPLPPDLKDNFAAAAWRAPHRYLDERYRANISSFRKADPGAVAQGVAKLAEELSSGVWKEKYGTVLNRTELDSGYRFIYTCTPNLD